MPPRRLWTRREVSSWGRLAFRLHPSSGFPRPLSRLFSLPPLSLPPSLCCSTVGSLAASIPLNSRSSFSVSSAAIPSALSDISLLILSRERFVNTKTDDRKMEVRNVAVYWNFRNIVKNFNDTVTLTATPKDITFEEGYRTFHMMAKRLAESDVKLDRNRYDNTRKFFSKDTDVNLRSLGPMLGFPKDTTVTANTWSNSPSNVDVNLGLRYVTVESSSVDTDRNFDRRGKRSKVIATLSVTTEQSLNSSVTFYDNVTSEAAVVNGDHNVFQHRKRGRPQGHARVVSRINYEGPSAARRPTEGPRNSCRAGTKEHLLRPFRGIPICEKVIPKGKGAKPGREQASGKGLIEDPGHLHEIQTYRQETQVPRNLRERSCGPGAVGSGGHGEVRKQKQGVPLDTNGRRNSEPVRLCNTRPQEGLREHDEGRTAVEKI